MMGLKHGINMEMEYLRAGRILKVDLTGRRISTEPIHPYIERFMRGKGINAKILFDSVRPEVGPLDFLKSLD